MAALGSGRGGLMEPLTGRALGAGHLQLRGAAGGRCSVGLEGRAPTAPWEPGNQKQVRNRVCAQEVI